MLTRISNPQGAPWRLGDVKTEKSYISQPPQVGTKPYSTLVVHPKKNERSLQCDSVTGESRWSVQRSWRLLGWQVHLAWSLPPVVRPALSFDDFDEHPVTFTFTWPCICGDTKKTRTVFGSLHFLVCSIICDTPKVGLIVLHSAFATVKFNWVMPNTYLTFHTKKIF